MAKEVVDGKKIELKRKTRYEVIEFDKLQLLFCVPYTIDLEDTRGSVVVKQPTIGNIINFGEKRFYAGLNPFITNASSYKVLLWDAGTNWNDISDFDLFIMLFKNLDQEVCNMLFENLVIENYSIVKKTKEDGSESLSLYSEIDDIEIDEKTYQHIHQCLQTIFNMFPEEKYTSDKMLQRWWVDAEKRKAKHEVETNEEKDSYSILPLISSCINHPGFKYNLQELQDVGVFQFYDAVKRLQVYESSTALLKGMYSGFMDGSKLKPDDYNFMKET